MIKIKGETVDIANFLSVINRVTLVLKQEMLNNKHCILPLSTH